jgi:hypothetical protein
MMIRTQRIRRISPTSRRPSARRQTNETRHGARRAEPMSNARRSAALPVPRRDVAAKPPKRRRARHLRLVAANLRPRWRRPVTPPTLRLIRGRAPLLALPPRRPSPQQARPAHPEPRSRVAQLAFVVAMTAIGLVALATSLGQLFARSM